MHRAAPACGRASESLQISFLGKANNHPPMGLLSLHGFGVSGSSASSRGRIAGPAGKPADRREAPKQLAGERLHRGRLDLSGVRWARSDASASSGPEARRVLRSPPSFIQAWDSKVSSEGIMPPHRETWVVVRAGCKERIGPPSLSGDTDR